VLPDGDRVDLGSGLELKVVHTPGHTPGSVCYYWEAEKLLLSGDAVQKPGVPMGKLSDKLTIKSQIYDGMVSDYWVYVPAQYTPDKPACLCVGLDGPGFMPQTVFDNLIFKKQMPVTIGVFISSGTVNKPGTNQPLRFDRSQHFTLEALALRAQEFARPVENTQRQRFFERQRADGIGQDGDFWIGWIAQLCQLLGNSARQLRHIFQRRQLRQSRPVDRRQAVRDLRHFLLPVHPRRPLEAVESVPAQALADGVVRFVGRALVSEPARVRVAEVVNVEDLLAPAVRHDDVER